MLKMDSMESDGLSNSLKIQETVGSMKSLAEYLLPYTFPNVSFEDEQEILCMKQRTLRVDGYESIICYSIADYEKYFLETLQIQSPQVPFIPFNVICKIGRVFLGDDQLAYIDFFRHNRKVYCWTLKSADGRKLDPGKKSTPTSFEGFDFHLLHPGSVDLF